MTENKQLEKTIGEQVAELLQRNSKNFDVTFSVGPQKTKVKAVKILLKAASPVFEKEFDQTWESVVMLQGEGIPLSDMDPTIFQLFVNLIISDTWSVDALNNLNLPPNNVLNLLGLCRHYKISKAIANLEAAAKAFIQNLYEWKDTPEFLKLSRENLETVLSCDDIQVDEREIFDCACRWADDQCQQKKVEPTGENFREVLGSSFFEISFPTMKFDDFLEISRFKKNLFTAEERLAIFQFIGSDECEKANYDQSQLPFKTHPRNSFGCSVLRLRQQFKTVQRPSFACNAYGQLNMLQVNKKISLLGVGFLGPIERDTEFDVTVQIQRCVYPSYTFDSGTLKKKIFARKGNLFHFLFDEPIIIEPNSYDINWNNFYYIFYSLKGANNVSQYKEEIPKNISLQISGVGFNLNSDWNAGNPLAELLFKKI